MRPDSVPFRFNAAMFTLFYSHPICIEHDTGEFHPECPDRLRAVMSALEAEEFAFLERCQAPLGELRDIKRVHAPYYVESVLENVPESGMVHLDPDTCLSPASGEAALRAVGAVCEAVDDVMSGRARNAFCAVRPPGHHAEPSQAMGFCLFNNVAVGALHAQAVQGAERVAVVDFDVHHGNGTQSAFERRENLFYASSHQSPCFPGTGFEHDRGMFDNIRNVQLPPGSGSDEFRAGYRDVILPRLREFNPDLLLVSAGFDAHARDPLAQIRLKTNDYAWVTRELLNVAEACCKGRVVSVLEGGYDMEALSDAVTVHVRALMAA